MLPIRTQMEGLLVCQEKTGTLVWDSRLLVNLNGLLFLFGVDVPVGYLLPVFDQTKEELLFHRNVEGADWFDLVGARTLHELIFTPEGMGFLLLDEDKGFIDAMTHVGEEVIFRVDLGEDLVKRFGIATVLIDIDMGIRL